MNQALVADFRVVGAADPGRFAPQMAQKLYFVAGEHSGDTRGAELMEAIRAVVPGLAVLWPGRAENAASGRFQRG